MKRDKLYLNRDKFIGSKTLKPANGLRKPSNDSRRLRYKEKNERKDTSCCT